MESNAIKKLKSPRLFKEKDAGGRIALTKLRDSAKSSGVDKMTLGEINRIISKVRYEKTKNLNRVGGRTGIPVLGEKQESRILEQA